MLHLLVLPQRELQLNLKKHPELSENLTIWKSDNQGFKEATFVQMGRRGREAEMDGEVRRCSVAWRDSGSGRMGSPTFTCSR